ncbi:reverse transcriptase domain-containing protein [Tanacetum coccineum]|uniref:Reverse transcriptase domain-containing protein n=1 Tax=Tanacetum coccineum TaxID=301880 RepID=A0ABQ4WYN6_9ASTR
MDGINIDDLTIKQYLGLTQENQTPSMVKKVDDMTIVSFEEELSSEEDLDEWLKTEMEKHTSKQNEKNEEDALIAIMKSIREECRDFQKNRQINSSDNVMPRSIYEYLKLANLGGTMLVKMDDMKQQETLGTVKNVLVKTDKFEFPCYLVVTDMPENLGEMIILGRPFLETIHAQIDVSQIEILANPMLRSKKFT